MFQEIYGYTKGTTANRPTGLGAGNEGALYYDTDVNGLIYWSGSTWIVPASTPTVYTLNSQFADVGNVGTGETDLMTYSLPGGTLTADGDRLEVSAWFTYASNANNKTLRLKWGAYVATWSPSEVTSSGGPVKVTLTIVRTSATTQRILWEFKPQFGTHSVTNTTGGETLSGAVTLKFTVIASTYFYQAV